MGFNVSAYELHKKAADSFRSEDYERAILFCRESLSLEEDSLTFGLLANVYEKLGDIPTAIIYYEKAEKGQKDLRYPRSLALKRAAMKKKFEAHLQKRDLASLLIIEEMYLHQDLCWHWAELRDYADILRKQKDYPRALTWINAALHSRMVQMDKDKLIIEHDSFLASLYVLRGHIYMDMDDYIAAIRVFIIATMQYGWKQPKALTLKINRALKKAGISDQNFNAVIAVAKDEGLTNGLSLFEKIIPTPP